MTLTDQIKLLNARAGFIILQLEQLELEGVVETYINDTRSFIQQLSDNMC